jgi:hypothetical protein
MDYLEELFTYLNSKQIDWVGEGTITNVIENDELLKLMAERCLALLVGLEDIAQGVRGSAAKSKLVSEFPQILRRLREYGVPVTWSMVFGLDSHTKDIYIETAHKIEECGLNTNIHIIAPRYGTGLFNQVTGEERWREQESQKRDGFHLVFEPKKMTWEEAMAGFIWLKRHISKPEAIARRWRNNLKWLGVKKASGLAFIDMTAGTFTVPHLLKMYSDLLPKIEWYEGQYQFRHKA